MGFSQPSLILKKAKGIWKKEWNIDIWRTAVSRRWRDVRWGEILSLLVFAGGAGYLMCAVSCESNVTAIKMEAGLPVGIFRGTNQTTSMMYLRKQRCMKR